MSDRPIDETTDVSRRDFVRTGAAALSAGAMLGPALGYAAPRRASDPIRVGLIGCGGRGTGAASQALNADPGVVLWAMGDAFGDRLESCWSAMQGHGAADRVVVPESRRFVGFDAYQQVIDSGVDVVILTTPPHFRPQHLAAAIDGGTHVFCEKPMAVDVPGVHSVLDSARRARASDLSLVSGFCWRYGAAERATYARIHDGAIGDVVAMHATYHTSPLAQRPRQDGWTDMEWQLRNWHHFTWLSGDHIVEQACHSIDKINWAMQNEAPVRATALGGRGVRSGPESGDSYDHFAVIYEYEGGRRCVLTCRQQPNCANDNSDYVIGTDGFCFVNGWRPAHVITGANEWRYDGPRPDMYQVEHDELFASIRDGAPLNDGRWMAQSTLMAILGRLAAYTGQAITWDQVMSSAQRLGPDDYAFGALETPTAARPGETPFV